MNKLIGFCVGFIVIAFLGLSFLLVKTAEAEVWPNGPYINYSTYWENKGIDPLVVRDAWKYADIVGFDKAKLEQGAEAYTRVEAVEMENRRLQNKINNLESRLSSLEREPQIQTVENTIVQQADMSAVTALEKRVSILEGVISMLEVNIGSIHARIDQLLAPVFQKLGL